MDLSSKAGRLKRCALAMLAVGLPLGGPALADSPRQCTVQWDALTKAHTTGPLTYKVFMTGCLTGRAPQSLPVVDAPDGAPAGATARCRDGSYTTATASLGACAHHRGVAAILR